MSKHYSLTVRQYAICTTWRRFTAVLATLTVLATAVVALAGPAAADEDMTPTVAGAASTRFAGRAFDTCDAPAKEVMSAWRTSPFGAVGIYISGDQRACDQKRLTAAWVREVSAAGWKLIPIDVGLQAPCADNRRLVAMSSRPEKAARQGAEAAAGALSAARMLGLLPGSAIYSDLEAFNGNDLRCAAAVGSYLSGWTRTLHASAYLAGVYGNLTSAIRVASASYLAPHGARLDAVWSAQWNGIPDTTRWAGVPDVHWAGHQRLKQYRGDHRERHGGRSLLIDSNIVDGPVATVARWHKPAFDQTPRVEPDAAAMGRPLLTGGAEVALVCRLGAGAARWHKLVDGTYLPAGATPSAREQDLITCAVPFQVMEPRAMLRAAPGLAAEQVGEIAAGALAWVVCEAPDPVRTAHWNRLADGSWLSGLATGQRPGMFHLAVPACATTSEEADQASRRAGG